MTDKELNDLKRQAKELSGEKDKMFGAMLSDALDQYQDMSKQLRKEGLVLQTAKGPVAHPLIAAVERTRKSISDMLNRAKMVPAGHKTNDAEDILSALKGDRE